jgi:putative membrane protein insertion efficiency factor
VPTCSEYGIEAFKKYGVLKGAILTAWRLSRCNPFGNNLAPFMMQPNW